MNICRNKITLFSLLFCLSGSVLAQNDKLITSTAVSPTSTKNIKGLIVDEKTNAPLDFATISVFKNNSDKQISASQSDLNGNFLINNLQEGSYKITFSLVGYEPFSKNITLSKTQQSLNIGNIKLKASKTSVLNEVVVTGKKEVIQLGIDKKVFNADQNLATQGGTATDLLSNVPSVSVDVDGNVSLRGTSNVKILIDGKPSSFGGGDVTQILNSLPANLVDKVELITNPSSKYEAEGQSGIINIVLKRNKNVGVNGNFSTSYGRFDNYNFNGGLNYRNEKWNLSGSYGYRGGNRPGFGFNSTQFLNNTTTTPFTKSNSESKHKDENHTGKIGIERFISEKASIAFNANLNSRDRDRKETGIQQFYDTNNNLLVNGDALNNEIENGFGYDLGLDYSQKMKNKGEELYANFTFSNSKEDEDAFSSQMYFDLQNQISTDKHSIVRKNLTEEKNKNYNIQLDYTKPLTEKSKLEFGYRSVLKYNSEDQIADTLILATNEYDRDNTLTTLFELEDIVHAVYGSYQNQLTENFGIQAGLRAEQAYLNTSVTGNNTSSLITEGNLNYFRVYPTLYLTQKLKNNHQLQLSYSRRVNRPRGFQVNPFPDMSDRYNIRIGNPNLKPEDIHATEFSYAKFWDKVTFTSSVYFRQVNDVIQSVRSNNPNEDGGTLSQFFNISRNRSVGLELISRADITKAWNVTGNLNFFQSYFKGDESLGIIANDGFNWSGTINSALTITKALSAQANFFYAAPRTMAQGKMKEMMSLDAGVKYNLLNNKASLGFNMQDILQSRKFGMSTNNGVFIQEFERGRYGRLYNISFSYRFGKMDITPKRNKKQQESQQGGEEMGF